MLSADPVLQELDKSTVAGQRIGRALFMTLSDEAWEVAAFEAEATLLGKG